MSVYKMKRRKRRGILALKILIPIVAVFVLLIVISYFAFTVKTVGFTGSTHYSDEELVELLFDRKAPNAVFYKLFGKNREIPFIQKYDVEIEWPDSMTVTIYEKPVIGYVTYMGSNMYFDKDGLIVESSTQVYSGIPCIEGLRFKSIILNQKLKPEGNENFFNNLLDLTQKFKKNELHVDKLYFDNDYNVTMYMNDVKVVLGDIDDCNDKIEALRQIKDIIADMKGSIDLSNYNSQSDTIVFKKEN